MEPGSRLPGLVDVVVVYKVDRLTRSLSDFAKLVELFEAHGVSFASPARTGMAHDSSACARERGRSGHAHEDLALHPVFGPLRGIRRPSRDLATELESGEPSR